MNPIDHAKASLAKSQAAVESLKIRCANLQRFISAEETLREKREIQVRQIQEWKSQVFKRFDEIELNVTKLNSVIFHKSVPNSAILHVSEEQKTEDFDDLDELESIVSTHNEETRRYLNELRKSLKKGQNIMT